MISPVLGARPFKSMSLPWALVGSIRSGDPFSQKCAVIGATGKPYSAKSMAG